MANGGLFRFPSSSSLEEESERELELLVEGSELLEEGSRKKLLENFKEFHELKGLFGELLTDLGTSLTTELIFLLHIILEEKLESFRTMQK